MISIYDLWGDIYIQSIPINILDLALNPNDLHVSITEVITLILLIMLTYMILWLLITHQYMDIRVNMEKKGIELYRLQIAKAKSKEK